ncbi:MAG: TrmH family RNA methyltransferase [bacterium]|nr:TrmH family RNA methyltransferase [bacterium]
MAKHTEIYVILHNVRSVYNVGSIFRTADAAGVAKIFLTGYTPTPIDRFGRARRDFAKVSLGAEQSVAWEYQKSASALIRELKSEGVFCVCVEQDKQSTDYRKITSRKHTAFLFGNEVQGVPPALRKVCNVIAEIPMRGSMVRHAHHPRQTRTGKESLNVSVAAGIMLFR